ncbi:phosphate ABC transporter, permease protein PstA [Halobacteroides halobius DSM 5150]|uniref:Phosphate transport system permease protein PstA n=1 Tax=Halobacteroides halobius (strain ATCC 35273 / DSM 5150 / MD-1) TaxID=748449 RepID=L0K9Q3_HALHC|nr:phosphate ABC transporter permease PstA [Halobacteroides halobius]AGB40808.1 phosphate ABC transporter, permease protein PstA [Halobacteroides halobius DSM 5150]
MKDYFAEQSQEEANKRVRKRKMLDKFFQGAMFLCTIFGIVMLAVLLIYVLQEGLAWLDFDFLTSYPSRFPEQAGLKSAFVGSIWVIGLVALISFPLGVGTALYLEEYADQNSWFFRILKLNIANLAGVPSVVYGLLGLAVFVELLNFGRSILAGAATLSLLILPVIIVAAQEAIKSVPDSLKEGAYALGMTKWQTIKAVVFPYAAPGIFTGVILALSRAMGEAAPLLIIGAAGYVPFLPRGPFDIFTVLPIQIFNWTLRPQSEFHHVASAGIIVLLVVLLTANGIAIILRNKYQKDID